jgi:osmotically-inducible protein OsmY
MKSRRLDTPDEEAIESALAQMLEIEYLRVSIVHGVPYIDGSVGALRDKRRAGQIVASLFGPGEFVNRLRVAPQVVRSDAAIAAAARGRVKALSEPGRIEIICRNGVVELEGEVRSWASRQAADGAARSVNGVVNVLNRLRVKGRRRPAGELEGEMKRALHEFLALDTRALEVKFDRGTVRLKGSVPSPYHRLAAEDLVRWFAPVQEVVNGLVVIERVPPSGSRDRVDKREASIPSA